jgi:signal transduction histidine kinase
MSPFEMTHRAIGEANLALRRLNEALEEQVRLIARELHDQSGQLLAAVHIALDEVARDLPEDRRNCLEGVKRLCDQVETQLRNLSHELRPTVLEDLGLMAALESLAQRIVKRTGLCIAIGPFDGPRLPARVEVALYRIVQEALNNVVKHAGATSVEIRLSRTGTAVECSISDNGIGFKPPARRAETSGGLGLLGIRERLQALQGELQIGSGPEQGGTKLKIMIPMEG